MVGLLLILFALHLAAALLARKPPREADRHVTMFGFLLLVPTVLEQSPPPTVLLLLSLFFAAYLRKAR